MWSEEPYAGLGRLDCLPGVAPLGLCSPLCEPQFPHMSMEGIGLGTSLPKQMGFAEFSPQTFQVFKLKVKLSKPAETPVSL